MRILAVFPRNEGGEHCDPYRDDVLLHVYVFHCARMLQRPSLLIFEINEEMYADRAKRCLHFCYPETVNTG